MDFGHVILTRFNVATPGREAAFRNLPSWLENRFDLFERNCLPTVAGQTSRNFKWLVYFDPATPAAFKAKIESYRALVAFHPLFAGIRPHEAIVVSGR